MPTFYKRKSRRGEWSEEQLKNAITAIENGEMGINEASRHFGIPSTTLRRRKNKNDFQKKSQGPSSVLGSANEAKMVNHIKKLQKNGFAPSRDDLRAMAYHLAEQLKIKHTFNRNAEKAGYDWLHLFLSRHPDLCIRKAEGFSVARSEGMSRQRVKAYFDLLESIYSQNHLFEKPSNVFNMDETGLQLNNKPGYVIAEKGSKSVPGVTSSERGETITVVVCANAEGIFIPPTCILKGKYEKTEFKAGMPPGSTIYMSEKSAYINADIFIKWLKEQFVPRKPIGKVLLILDGHASHCNSVEMLEYAEEHDIILLCLPSHTTHYLQPLDRGFFKSFKSHYNNACRHFMKSNPSRKITRLSFGQLLNEAWFKAATVNNAVSSFRATGIFPFNPEIIPDYAYLNDSSEKDLNDNTLTTVEVSPERNIRDISPQPSTSNAAINRQLANTTPKKLENDFLTPGKLLDTIAPVPSCSGINKIRKRARNVALELTSPENITKQKKKSDDKSTKSKKQKKGKPKQTKKKVYCSSSSEADTPDPVYAESDESDIQITKDECVGCGEEYSKTKKREEWIQCILCQRWMHENCTKYVNVCDFCAKYALHKRK